MLRAFQPLGAQRAVWLSALLFGALHLLGLAFGRDPLYVLVQVIFNVFFGVTYDALRLRTGTIWPLILLHAAGNVVLKGIALDVMPFAAVVVGYGLFGSYGLWLLRTPSQDGAASSKERIGCSSPRRVR